MITRRWWQPRPTCTGAVADRLTVMDPHHLSGQALYGDDFTLDQIEQWFEDEANAYFEMSGSRSQEAEHYGYVELTVNHYSAMCPPQTVAFGMHWGSVAAGAPN